MTAPRFRYSRWDGTQRGFDLDAEAILAEAPAARRYPGALDAARGRVMQTGLRDRNGERVQGMRDLLERLRRQRRERLQQHNLGGGFRGGAAGLRAARGPGAR